MSAAILPGVFNSRIIQHIAFWLFYYIFYVTLYGSFDENYLKYAFLEGIYLPVKILATYFSIYYLMPYYLLKSRYKEFFLWFTIFVMVAGMIQRTITYYVEYPLYYPQGLELYPLFYWLKILKSIVSIYPVVFIAGAIKLLKYWIKNREDQQVLVKEKLQAELKFLKTQIHPHFLFNTLNNLYALTLKKSDQAPEMVLKLSDLINYMLYECNADTVDLQHEVDFINNYIDIEKIRYGDKLEFSLNIEGNIENKQIAPMLILPFVENCFKHGVSKEIHHSWISIDLSLKGNDFTLKAENSKGGNGNNQTNNNEGIGLKNVKRRLDLIYPNNHELQTFDEKDVYLVVLKINLSSKSKLAA